ncbi:response regulator transcription factor [Hyphobacterium sp. CCMP332]|nr:response regulator transcription factor [Hyphobacterium sp. CCMP332]
MINCIIVDDERRGREALSNMISEYCPQIQVLETLESVDQALKAISALKPELVFLDVELQGETGFDLLDMVPKIDFEVIFTTAHEHYALKAIKFSAIDYILKPISTEDLKEAVKKAEEKLSNKSLHENFDILLKNIKNSNKKQHKIALASSDGYMFTEVSDILYCTADGNYTYFFTKNTGKILVSKNIKEYEGLLNDHNFFRIHRSHLINMDEVKKYVRGEGGYVIMSDGSSLDVSKRRKEQFISLLAK